MTGAAAGKVSVYAAAVLFEDCSVTALALVLAKTSVPRVELDVPNVTCDVNLGLVANTRGPNPVSSVTADARFADDGVAKNVATPVPRPLTPVLIGSPVALVSVAEDGVPKLGVTSVGEVAKTRFPEPVSSVTAAAKLALDGVASHVATPVPRPDRLPTT